MDLTISISLVAHGVCELLKGVESTLGKRGEGVEGGKWLKHIVESEQILLGKPIVCTPKPPQLYSAYLSVGPGASQL